eukprot:TRINITY_DN1716_c0_g1_i1.p2 TRINITY_DN1716_c0_g1~~TRINITY_DN1716_c0_g1_i1.p2  ORF type:complete len:233 (-),score=33.80 TRINITY_DN1716_c0_g1_i1:360-1058(-)
MGIVRGITRGLTYLHTDLRPPMVHRDIKAANVLLTNETAPEACIADFGLARLVEDLDAGTSTMVKGTVPYMAPEYLHGGPRYLSPKCDVYSFGLLLLEIVSGQPVVKHRADGSVESLSKVAADLIRQGRELELVDGRLGEAYDSAEAICCIRLAMGCLHSSANGRPTMEQATLHLATGTIWSAHGDLVEEGEGSGVSIPSGYGITSEYSMSESSSFFEHSTQMVASRFIQPR